MFSASGTTQHTTHTAPIADTQQKLEKVDRKHNIFSIWKWGPALYSEGGTAQHIAPNAHSAACSL
jgi:hypothetical protein